MVGRELLKLSDRICKDKLKALRDIDWSRSNARLWDGRAMIGGRVSKASHNVTLTTNLVKQKLGLELGPEEKRVENAYKKGRSGNA
jgi:DNA sulfur modification protein DndB